MFASLRNYNWKAGAAGAAITLAAIGGFFAAWWGLIAGLWTFSTGEFGPFAGVIAVTAILVAAPVISFRAISRSKYRLVFAVTIPALAIYAAVIAAILLGRS